MTTPDSKEAPELKACPFCGGRFGTPIEGHFLELLSAFYIECPCGAEMNGQSADLVRTNWNTRADLVNRDPSEGDVERVAKALGREETGLDDESLDGLVWHPSSNSWRVPDMPRWKQWEDAARAAINAWRNP